MTTRQAFAIANIVRDPNNTKALEQFAKTIVNAAGRFGTILTVDKVEEGWCWHVSVTTLSEFFKPVSWKELKPSERESVRRLARELLEDVGRPDTDLDMTEEESYQIIR